jgi:hypothetical protein
MRSPTRTGTYVICSGVFMSLIPVLAWIPAVFFGRRAGDERYFSVGFYNVAWAMTIAVIASTAAIVLLTAGAIRSLPRLPRWSSPWWAPIWFAGAWLPMALLLVVGWFGLPKNVDLSVVLVYAAGDWALALSLSAVGLLLLWIARTAGAAAWRKFRIRPVARVITEL